MNNTTVDSCGNPMYFTSEEFTCPPGDTMCCTAKFDANPDASGVGIVIAFASNGAINMSLATFLWYLKNFKRPNHPYFEKYIQNLSDFLAQASLFLGITLLVAALSQFRTITHFHLWVSVILADLATSGRVVVLINVWYSHQRLTRIQAALAALFQALFLASLGILIYRLSNWSNDPGHCFALYKHGEDSLAERDFVRAWVIVQLCLWFYWHLICPWQMYVARHMLEKVPRTVKFWFSFVFYVILDLFIWIWQLYLIGRGMLANKDRIIGSEWQLGFGQVASLVALMTVFYAIFLSWQDYLLKRRKRRNDGLSTEGTSREELNDKEMEMAFVSL